MPKQIVIKIPEWINDNLLEEASKILLLVEINKNKSPRGLIKEVEKFETKLTKEEVDKFLEERR
ncbi:hypothetical protein DRP07_09120 [Archaeoglobales archaeon]|nr:MAG: hypothetical protein DRP07_09120 [Archaeoglobales archaeon]